MVLQHHPTKSHRQMAIFLAVLIVTRKFKNEKSLMLSQGHDEILDVLDHLLYLLMVVEVVHPRIKNRS